MRQQALILIAAVALCTSAMAQHAYFPSTLSIVKSYDIANINKAAMHTAAHSNQQVSGMQIHPSLAVPPRLNLPDLKSQLGNDIKHLKLEQRNQQWQGMFQGFMQGVRSNNQPGNRL